MLDRSSPLPLYFQLRTLLLEQIEGGDLKPGDLVPTERELIDRYGVSRITVRQAVNSLMSDGLIYRQRGRGTFVRRNRIEQQLATLTGFYEEMANRGLAPATRLLSAEMIDPDCGIAAKLRLKGGENALRMVRVQLANDEPMALDISHFPPDLGERLLRDKPSQAVYAFLEEIGVELDWADQAIESTLADEFTARHLGIKKGMPVLLVERTMYSSDGRAVEYTRAFYRADRYAYRIRLNRKGSAPSRLAPASSPLNGEP